MKIFDQVDGYMNDKVNFVDENNVILGYDMGQCCCEHADWYIHTSISPDPFDDKPDVPNVTDYVFDPSFFHEVDGFDGEDGGMVVFKIVGKQSYSKRDLYIHIFNIHNGYYSHGFTFTDNDNVVQDGSL